MTGFDSWFATLAASAARPFTGPVPTIHGKAPDHHLPSSEIHGVFAELGKDYAMRWLS